MALVFLTSEYAEGEIEVEGLEPQPIAAIQILLYSIEGEGTDNAMMTIGLQSINLGPVAAKAVLNSILPGLENDIEEGIATDDDSSSSDI